MIVAPAEGSEPIVSAPSQREPQSAKREVGSAERPSSSNQSSVLKELLLLGAVFGAGMVALTVGAVLLYRSLFMVKQPLNARNQTAKSAASGGMPASDSNSAESEPTKPAVDWGVLFDAMPNATSLPTMQTETSTALQSEKSPSPASKLTEASPANAEAKDAPPAAGKQAGETRDDNLLSMKMVWCEPGKFTMGDLEPEVIRQNLSRGQGRSQATKKFYQYSRLLPVTLTKGFWIGQTEVTQGEWKKLSDSTPWNKHGRGDFKEGDAFPATYINYEEAIQFCDTLTNKERAAKRLAADWKYTLPTEAQWEYACRAGTTTAYSFGDDEHELSNYAWGGNPVNLVERHPHEVAQKRPNPWGLFDMHGNVRELVLDGWWSPTGGTDPLVFGGEDRRTARGGGWDDTAFRCRSGYREGTNAAERSPAMGLRIAMTLALNPAPPEVVRPLPPDLAKFVPHPGPAGRGRSRPATRSHQPTQSAATTVASGAVQTPEASPRKMRDDNALKMKFVWCGPGKFKMGTAFGARGSRGPNENQVEVTLTKEFWLGQTEVTQRQWEQLMQTTPWRGRSFAQDADELPATYVSYNDAIRFCETLTDSERRAGRLAGDCEYTLPTEAQWEYACRAGTQTPYSFGQEGYNQLIMQQYTWFRHFTQRSGTFLVHRVGLKQPNPWQLYDMHGNAWEWCRDWFTQELSGGADPGIYNWGTARVDRGGSCNSVPECCRSAFRGSLPPDRAVSDVGFRVALCTISARQHGDTVSDAKLGFTLVLPYGFKPQPELVRLRVAHAFSLGGSAYGLSAAGYPKLTILNLTSIVGPEPIAASIVSQYPGLKATTSTMKWQGFDVEVIRVAQPLIYVPTVTFNVIVPLKQSAIVVKLTGPADSEAQLKQLLDDTLEGLKGESNW
ncbi:MAG TPA: formylglycine-generating enzyme family protein [Planctomycetaceae bacterium]|nr:formylglycine-generating enzyme family protein [Planctomycetaceae bacterium]